MFNLRDRGTTPAREIIAGALDSDRAVAFVLYFLSAWVSRAAGIRAPP
ncbi:MAG TPA: hypothetical protein VI636_23195 [Candidatus Angelobacter sp.]